MNRAATIVAIPIGTLTRKIQCHDHASTISPPRIGPIAMPDIEIPLQMPIAFPRSAGGNDVEMIESVNGMMNAAPIPCAARAAISQPVEGTNAARADVAVKTARPSMKNRLRPNRSPRPPAVICRDAKTSTYADMIHCSCAVVGEKSSEMVGNAMLTIRLSRTAMKRATQQIARMYHLDRSLIPVACGANVLMELVAPSNPVSSRPDVPDDVRLTRRTGVRHGPESPR